LETCATLGMLTPGSGAGTQSRGPRLSTTTISTPRAYYEKIISTRTYQDRLDTLQAVRDAGMNVCCGGIVGMGEEPQDRVALLHTLATLPEHPQSVPINQLVRVAGTPLADAPAPDPFDFVRTIAVARILMPRASRAAVGGPQRHERRTAGAVLPGRREFDFYGEKLLTTGNPDTCSSDRRLFERLKIAAPSPLEPLAAEAGHSNALMSDESEGALDTRLGAALLRSRRRKPTTAAAVLHTRGAGICSSACS
jgi:biotin synthase